MFIITVVVGMLIGGTAVWVVQRGKLEASYKKGKQEGEVERSVLTERLSNTERMLQEAKSSVETLTGNGNKLEEEISLLKVLLSETQTRLERRESGAGEARPAQGSGAEALRYLQSAVLRGAQE